MTRDVFAFYAKHYTDLGHLRNLEKDVQERYPDELWKMIQKIFFDRFLAGPFAGLRGWECTKELDGPDDSINLWHPRYFDEKKRGPYFCIEPFSHSVTDVSSSNKQFVRQLIYCYVGIDKNGGNAGITYKALVAAVQKDAPRLRKQFEQLVGMRDCFVQIDIGDLLHISAFGGKQKNFEEMVRRVEKLVRACMPIFDKVSQQA
jgi:hypothetical protein